MPIVQLKDCQIEGDLAQAVLDLQQQISEITSGILIQTAAITPPTTELGQTNAIMQNMILQSPTPIPPDQLADQIGTPHLDPSELDDEERLEDLGVVLIRSIMYLADGSGNIDAYRRLFFAVGADINLFLSIVGRGTGFAVTQTLLQVQKLPVKSNWNLADVRALFNNPAIEAIYNASDGEQYVIVPRFLGLNKSKEEAARLASVSVDQIQTQVFWLTSVTQTPDTIAKLSALGIESDELTATLFGDRLISVKPSTEVDALNNVSLLTGKVLAQLGLLTNRYQKISPADREVFKQEALQTIGQAQQALYDLQEVVRFQATVLSRPADISDFLIRNSQDDLSYLFTERRGVSGIKFTATTQEISSKIRQIISIPAGNSTVSSLRVNSTRSLLDPQIDAANGRLVRNVCAQRQLTNSTPLLFSALQTAIACLQQSLQTPPVAVPSPLPQVGYASHDSPASILTKRLNFALTLNTNAITDAIDAAAQPLNAAERAVVLAILAIIKQAQAAIDQVLGAFRDQVSGFISQLQGTLSQYTSFFGTASLDSSILKCALGFSLKTDMPILDELAGVVDLLRRKLRNMMADVAKTIGDILAKLMCLIPNLLNGFITGVQNALPSVCQLNKVQLPKDIDDALNQLRNGFALQSTSVQAFSRDALRITATTQALPLLLGQFRESLSCESTASDQFFKASASTIGATVQPNPTAALAGILR